MKNNSFCTGDKYERVLSLFPEFNTRLAKFAVGVYRWILKGEIDPDQPDDVDRVHTILQIIDSSPAFDFFDNLFNEVTPDEVGSIIGMAPGWSAEESLWVADYTVYEVKCYADLILLKDMVGWCIVVSEEAYNDYVANKSRFYICANKGWRSVSCQAGRDFPLDNYGLSLLAVEIAPDYHIKSITTRWNDSGVEVAEDRLREWLGDRFHMLGR